MYEATLAHRDLYGRERFLVAEERETLPGIWRRLDDFDMTSAPLYPDGLLEILRER